MRTEFDAGLTVSSHCHDGSCVAVSPTVDGNIAVLDSKNLDLPPHLYSREEWRAFILGVKEGQFDFGMQINRVTPWAAARRSSSRRRR